MGVEKGTNERMPFQRLDDLHITQIDGSSNV